MNTTTSMTNAFESGDLLFGKLRPYLAKVWLAEFPGQATTECLVMTPMNIEPRFLRYVCLSYEFISAVDTLTFGSKMPRADWASIRNLAVPFPECGQQRAIADYLDSEMARLDKLLKTKEQALELISERRQGLISHVVTKGLPLTNKIGVVERLQKNRKSKSGQSRVPRSDATHFKGWIERLPERWEAKPLRSVADCIFSHVDKLEIEGERPVRLCNYTDVYHNEFITLDLDFMPATASASEVEKFGIRMGDVLITKDSESWDDIGIPALVQQTSDDLLAGYHLAIIRVNPDKIAGAFLFRCLQARLIRSHLELAAVGITRFGLSKSDIGSLTLPVPPIQQQHAIASYLDREIELIDALAAEIQRSVNLLREHRSALISSAVAGKIDMEMVA